MTTDIYRRLHRLVRLFQEKNRFVLNAYETGLPLLTSRIITDVSAREGISSSELAAALSLSPTAISRAISELKEQKIIAVTSDPLDQRRQRLTLTSKGVAALKLLDSQAEARLEQFCSRLLRAEEEMLIYFMRVFAEGLSANPLMYERKEHPLRPSIRRITQVLGLLENKVLGAKDLMSIEWHVLEKIAEQSGSVLAKTLSVCFDLRANTVAGIVARLIKGKLVSRVVNTRDRRQAKLQLSKRGEALLADIATRATDRYRTALSGLTTSQVEDFVSLLAQFLGDTEPTFLSPDGDLLLCRQITTDDERSEAREFCAQNALRVGQARKISEHFFTEHSFCFVLSHLGEIRATAEFQPPIDPAHPWVLTHCMQHSTLDELPLLAQFIETAAARFRVYKPDVQLKLGLLVWEMSLREGF
jgi:DNA-binding MarR family transcriptional regulator